MGTLSIFARRLWGSKLGKVACLLILSLARLHLAPKSRLLGAELKTTWAGMDRGEVYQAQAVDALLQYAASENLLTQEQWTQLHQELARSGVDPDTFTGRDVVNLLSVPAPKIFGWHDHFDELVTTVFDPIPKIAEHLLKESDLGDDGIIVPLCMDITNKGEHGKTQFKNQVKDTATAACLYPGRVLPFYGVNTNRSSCLDLFYAQFGRPGEIKPTPFVGVKIYPTECYDVYSKAMRAIWKRCDVLQLPVTQHTNDGGFSVPDCTSKGYPELWETKQLLQDYPNIRINFAHFGGDDFMKDQEQKKWHEAIKAMMARYPDQVFTDISYNTALMGDDLKAEQYLADIKSVLGDSVRQRNLLWGTDAWLLYLSDKEEDYTRAFKQKLARAIRDAKCKDITFQVIAEANPMRFLGMNADSPYTGARPNIQRYVEYMWKHSPKKWKAAPWLSEAFKEYA